MQLQIAARKQALKENEVHTPTFSAPTFSVHDSVPRLTGVIGPPSPTVPSSVEGKLSRKWDISFTRKEEDAQKLDEHDIAAVLRPRAPLSTNMPASPNLSLSYARKETETCEGRLARILNSPRPLQSSLPQQSDRSKSVSSVNLTDTSGSYYLKRNAGADELDTELIRNARNVFSYVHLRDRVRADTHRDLSESGDDLWDCED